MSNTRKIHWSKIQSWSLSLLVLSKHESHLLGLPKALKDIWEANSYSSDTDLTCIETCCRTSFFSEMTALGLKTISAIWVLVTMIYFIRFLSIALWMYGYSSGSSSSSITDFSIFILIFLWPLLFLRFSIFFSKYLSGNYQDSSVSSSAIGLFCWELKSLGLDESLISKYCWWSAAAWARKLACSFYCSMTLLTMQETLSSSYLPYIFKY